jgi:hypothetical protein
MRLFALVTLVLAIGRVAWLVRSGSRAFVNGSSRATTDLRVPLEGGEYSVLQGGKRSGRRSV